MSKTYTHEQMRALLDAITPPPWHVVKKAGKDWEELVFEWQILDVGYDDVASTPGYTAVGEHDAAFIAAAPDIVIQLLDEVWDHDHLKKYADTLTTGLADLREKALDLSDGQTLAECVGDPECVILHARDQLIAARAEIVALQAEIDTWRGMYCQGPKDGDQ